MGILVNSRSHTFVLCLAAVFLSSAAADSGPATAPRESVNFSFAGKPIHPECIMEFEVWPSDHGPSRVRAVDIQACTESNASRGKLWVAADGSFAFQPDGSEDWFSYKVLGRIGESYVLLTQSGGRGTYIAEGLKIVQRRREPYFEFSAQGQVEPRQREELRCIAELHLGDRDDGDVTVRGNTIVVGKSEHRPKEVRYDIPTLARDRK